MKRLMGLWAMLSLVAVGCGGNSFTGTVDGSTLAVKDAIFGQVTSDDPSAPGQALFIYMSDVANICDVFQSGKVPPNITTFGATLVAADTSTGEAVTPVAAKYEVGSDLDPTSTASTLYGGFAQFSTLDANCNDTIDDNTGLASSGFIQVDSLTSTTSGTLTGSFDLTFGTSDVVKGTIRATYCSVSTTANLNCASTNKVRSFKKSLRGAKIATPL